MAESTVKSAANWLGKIIVEEGKYLWGVEDKVSELRKELVWMQCFLRDADSLQYDDEIIAQWVLEIKEHVYEAEDIVDKFVIQVASIRRQSGRINKLRRWSRIGMELFVMHQVATSIDSLIQKISNLTPRLQTYGLKTAYGMKTYHNKEALLEQAQQRMSYIHLNTKSIVGLEQDTEMIINALLDSTMERRVVGIYGMGGLGKTTLATKVYNDKKIKEHFTGGCAWAYISKQLQGQNALQIILADLTSKSADMMTAKSTKDLICELREFLQKHKCLVVLDDVWKKEDWDFLYDAFPSSGVASGSKFFLTTRKEEVAKYADSGALPKPDPLCNDISWELLQHTLGWDAQGQGEKGAAENNDATDIGENTEGDNFQTDGGEKGAAENNDATDISEYAEGENVQTDEGNNKLKNFLTEMFGSNGTEVVELGKAMVKHCNGIPLAIVVLGGILKKKQTVEEWRLVRENITSYLRRGNDQGRSYIEVLVLSYNDLPYHLKPCFLHLGNFPEDYDIHTEKLYRMWVAEGLVTWPRDRVAGTESIEDVANEYLTELAQAGVVQITRKGSNGRIKSIRFHDLMRDVCLQKSVAENFLSIIDHRSCPGEPQNISSSSNHERMLRMAVYLAQDVKEYLPDSITTKAHEYLRSLMFFVAPGVQEGSYEQWIEGIFDDFTWLRVLDIEGLHLKGGLTKNVQKVRHLSPEDVEVKAVKRNQDLVAHGWEKKELGYSMLKHCSSKPSSILLLAGLLAMKQTLIEWHSIQKELDSRMEKAQGPEPIIHALSYDDLPPHLKHCFLYLSILPEDVEISTRKLTRMWIAAGFVKLKENESEAIELLENVAESYLNELVLRGLVHVGKRGPTGRISTCYLHIVMQNLCSTKVTEERFVMEHLAVHLNQGERRIVENTTSTSKSYQLRSLLFFPKINDVDNGDHNWEWFIKLCNRFRLLRVLDLEGLWLCKGVLLAEVGNLNQLRYLSLRGTRVSEIPPTIQQLINLETLDLRVMESLIIPDVLFSFRYLRHLYMPDSIAVKSPKLQFQGLDHLRELVNLNTEKNDLHCLPELKSLTRITVRNIHEEKEFNDKFESVSTLVDMTFHSGIFEGNPTALSKSEILQRVRIKGELSVPLDVGMFPECMKELTLKHTKLKHDLLVLGKLPGLARLVLDHKSFIGKKLTFTKGSFPQLIYLRLRLLSNLEELDVTEAEHLTRYQGLDVKDCWRLKIKDVKFVSNEIQPGPLRKHPLLGLLS